ncbi:MAG: Transamidase GatB domain protein, partial [uncultured Sphingomonadaceae bacterium]
DPRLDPASPGRRDEGGRQAPPRRDPPHHVHGQESRHRGAHGQGARGRRRARHRGAGQDDQAAPRINRDVRGGRPSGARRCRGRRDRGDRELPAPADERGRGAPSDRRDRDRDRRSVGQGHGPRHGAGEGTSRGRDGHEPSERAREGAFGSV